MERVRVEAIVQPNGRVVIENLPFEEGKEVDVIVIEHDDSKKAASDNLYPLRGTPYQYDDPFSPLLPDDEWEPLK